MLMCLLRFKEPYNTDILFTLNVPDKFSDKDEEGPTLGEPGQSEKYKEFLKEIETDFYNHMLPSFTVESD